MLSDRPARLLPWIRLARMRHGRQDLTEDDI